MNRSNKLICIKPLKCKMTAFKSIFCAVDAQQFAQYRLDGFPHLEIFSGLLII